MVVQGEDDGDVPLVQWLSELPLKVIQKCQAKLDRLEELGHERRRGPKRITSGMKSMSFERVTKEFITGRSIFFMDD